jgi:hypothetical protein
MKLLGLKRAVDKSVSGRTNLSLAPKETKAAGIESAWRILETSLAG